MTRRYGSPPSFARPGNPMWGPNLDYSCGPAQTPLAQTLSQILTPK